MTATENQNAPMWANGDKSEHEKEIRMVAPLLLIALQQPYRPFIRALLECNDELQQHAIKLLKTITNGEIDEEDRFAATAVLADVLFPNPADDGFIGIDLKECESQGANFSPETRDVLAEMDAEERTFAEQLTLLMEAKGLTQEALASKLNIGQPAISMMLTRDCRPQRKTVFRLAEALGVNPDDLWPGIRK